MSAATIRPAGGGVPEDGDPHHAVDRIVAATLYEGYLLYPYRPSAVKNRVRWTFGGLTPRAFSEGGGGEPWSARTECLLEAGTDASVRVRLRFLHLSTRTVGRPSAASPDGAEPAFEPVPELRTRDRVLRPGEEALERDLLVCEAQLHRLLSAPVHLPIDENPTRSVEVVRGDGGVPVGAVAREQEELAGEARVRAHRIEGSLIRVLVEVRNTTPFDTEGPDGRDRAMRRALLSIHVILEAHGGRWLSLADPPATARAAAAACANVGLWPVLVDPSDTVVLASPIILEDHPRVAPESPGDLFDATEIDEILTLRILTLTDAEKEEARLADPRARALLDRTEALDDDALTRMHGAIRALRPARGEP